MRYYVLVLVVVLFAGCCSHPTEEKALLDAIAVNKGHMADEALPSEARAVAQDNYDFDWQVLYSLTGKEMPADVKARMDARKEGAQ